MEPKGKNLLIYRSGEKLYQTRRLCSPTISQPHAMKHSMIYHTKLLDPIYLLDWLSVVLLSLWQTWKYLKDCGDIKRIQTKVYESLVLFTSPLC